ncbi:hypothetical protein LWI28_023691 [Acer negundo]|uniref:Uncharacterized protein n=1 Tax=Acer negundo TaxID=4023 RepID=A0AAD5IJF4_ACENE|nr:hypothetical protein LWI28_023691 [Acer negundo]
MKTLFISQDLWEYVEEDYATEGVAADVLKDVKKKDVKALFFIQQAVAESIFPRISATTKSKEAWDALKNGYQDNAKLLKEKYSGSSGEANKKERGGHSFRGRRGGKIGGRPSNNFHHNNESHSCSGNNFHHYNESHSGNNFHHNNESDDKVGPTGGDLEPSISGRILLALRVEFMIVWLLYAEQRMNATLLTEELGVAVRSEKLPSNRVVGREEIKSMVGRVMADEEEGKAIRRKVKEIKRSAERAQVEGGVAPGLIEFPPGPSLTMHWAIPGTESLLDWILPGIGSLPRLGPYETRFFLVSGSFL